MKVVKGGTDTDPNDNKGVSTIDCTTESKLACWFHHKICTNLLISNKRVSLQACFCSSSNSLYMKTGQSSLGKGVNIKASETMTGSLNEAILHNTQ